MTDIDMDQYLFDLTRWEPSREPRVAAVGRISGVAMPEVGPIQHGALVTADYARTLGAQLIRAADLHDAIQDAAPRDPISPEGRAGIRNARPVREHSEDPRIDDLRGEADR